MIPLDDALLRSVEDGSLPASAFHHREHVYVTWRYLRSLPLEEALAKISRVLRAFATTHGVPGHYHTTMTWAYVLLLDEAMRRVPDEPFEALFRRVAGGRARIAALYGVDELESAEARARFLLPRAIREACAAVDEEPSG